MREAVVITDEDFASKTYMDSGYNGRYRQKQDQYRIASRCSNLNSRSPAVTLLIFLGLSLWTSPASMNAEAFAILAIARPRQRLQDVVGLDQISCGDGYSSPSSRERSRKHRLPGTPSVSMTIPRSSRDQRQRGLTPANAASATADGSNLSVEKEKVIDEAHGNWPRRSRFKSKQKKGKDLLRVTSVTEMRQRLSEGRSLFELDARGDSQDMLEIRTDEHPVLQVMRERAKAGTRPGSRGDGLKV